MVGRPAKARSPSTRTTTAGSRKSANAPAKKARSAGKTTASTSLHAGALVEVVPDDAESIRSQSTSCNSRGSVDVIAEHESDLQNDSKIDCLRRGVARATSASEAPVVDVDVKTPEPVECSSQASQPLTGCPSTGDTNKVTCVSDNDEEDNQGERDRCASAIVSSSNTWKRVSSTDCASSDSGGDVDNDEEEVRRCGAEVEGKKLVPGAMWQRSSLSSPSHSPAVAPILHVSRLTDYFTYGVQAAMTHYAEHFYEEESSEAEEAGAEERLHRANHSRATARYHNAFLTEAPHRAPTTEQKNRCCTSHSRSSSAATYDSDAESGATLLGLHRGSAKAAEAECLLEPQLTSLYRAPPSSNVAQAKGAEESWSPATTRSAAPLRPTAHGVESTSSDVVHTTGSRGTRKAPVSSIVPPRDTDWRSGNALACFREALRRAYACEDAVRQWRRDEVNRQRTQLIDTLTKLQKSEQNREEVVMRSGEAAASKKAPQPQQRSNKGNAASLSLSSIAEFAEASSDVTSNAPASSKPNARGKGIKKVREPAGTVDLLYTVDDNDDSAQEGEKNNNRRRTPPISYPKSTINNAVAASSRQQVGISSVTSPSISQASAASRHVLQVMDPSQLYKLRRTPSVLVETLLKYHREAQRKQQAAQHTEDQTAHIRRLYELPILTEDIVRYASLLLCLKRTNKRPVQSAAELRTPTNNLGNDEIDLEGLTSPTAVATNSVDTQSDPTATAAAAAVSFVGVSEAAVGENLPPYGEDNSLLYMKYPAPLLRTTSFAVETVRLLKWLRTWRGSGPGPTGGLSPPPPPISSASPAPAERSQRKRAKVEAAAEHRKDSTVPLPKVPVTSPVGGEASASAVVVSSSMDSRVAQRSTIEEVQRQAQRVQQASEAQAKEEKRNAFLKFFGSAVAASSAVKVEKEPVEVVDLGVKTEDGALATSNDSTREVQITKPAISTERQRAARRKGETKASSKKNDNDENEEDADEEQVVVRQPLREASVASPAEHDIAVRPSPPSLLLLHPAVYAYQLYCHAWRHAVRTGITPLATAAQAFAGSRLGAATLRQDGAISCTSRSSSGGTAGAPSVPRVCAALPFYKEMQAESQRTALGSAARDVYYEDAYGNRLRSARLAQKEQEKQAQLAAQQRRLAKQKGYFHRNEYEEGSAAAGRSAAAMLEAMLYPTTAADLHETRHQRHHAKRKRRRARDSSSEDESSPVYISADESEGEGRKLTNVASAAAPSGGGMKGKTHTARGRRASASFSDVSSDTTSLHSRSSSSRSSSGVDTDGDVEKKGATSTGSALTGAGSKDEITNIAVVSGPTGAGKTAAVYVAAQLLGFRVVEMNAAVRRCPKTVEHLLAELTRSYRLSSLRPGSANFNAEEELTKLKQQHAAMVAKAQAEAEALERETEQKKREARKANGISAQAVANFFSKRGSSGSSTSAESKSTRDKTGKQQQQQQRRHEVSTAATNVDDAGEEEVDEEKEDGAVEQVHVIPPDTTATGSSLSPPPPLLTSTPASPGLTQSSTAAAASAAGGAGGGTRTLLLFEDADILLGDESAKSFYAAIRDLANRSKVPIVVTVSADSSPAQRYDTSLYTSANVQTTSLNSASLTSTVLSSTYWQLCEEAGLNTSMDMLEASYAALHASPVLGDRFSNAMSSENGSGGGGAALSGTESTLIHSGGNSPLQNVNNTASSSLLSLFSPVHSPVGNTAGNGGHNTTSTSGGAAGGPSSAGAGGANASGAAAAAATLAARYTHMLLNASLVSNFFGSQTPFTVVDALPTSALFAQLLAVGAVELNLLQWQMPPSPSPSLPSPHGSPLLSHGSAGAGEYASQALLFTQILIGGSQQQQQQQTHSPVQSTPSSSTWQQDMDRLTASLTLRDPDLFFELAARLCHALFGVPVELERTEKSCDLNSERAGSSVETDEKGEPARAGLRAAPRMDTALPTAIQCDAAGRTTTDIRYWLNRLQMLLLTLQARSSTTSNRTACASGDETEAHRSVTACEAEDEEREGRVPQQLAEERKSQRCAERLVENEFQHQASFAASSWDTALGRYMSSFRHNELQSSRYEYWLLDDHVDYASDIVGELNTQDHPTLHVDYTAAPPGTKASSSTTKGRRGRPPSSQNARKSGRSGNDASSGANENKDDHPAEVSASSTTAYAHKNNNMNNNAGSGGGGGGLNSAWKALFSGGKGNPSTSSPASTTAPAAAAAVEGPTTPSPPSMGGGQQTLFGFPRGPLPTGASSANAAASGAVFDVPARFEWPPTLPELRRRAGRHHDICMSTLTGGMASRVRPIELLLPYSTAQAYYDAAATTAAASALSRVPDTADPSPVLLGHDTPLRFVNRQGGRETVEEDGDYCEVGREMPSSVHVTQEERFAVFRRWWRRTRKVGALRDSVAGRSPAALEDMLGYGCLLAPTSAAAAASNNGTN